MIRSNSAVFCSALHTVYILLRDEGVRFCSKADCRTVSEVFGTRSVTLTLTRTGLRMPTRTISLKSASVIVALKHPVRRCLGKAASSLVSTGEKPRSSSRSASSKMTISIVLRSGKRWRLAFVLCFLLVVVLAMDDCPSKSSSSLPGVPTMIVKP